MLWGDKMPLELGACIFHSKTQCIHETVLSAMQTVVQYYCHAQSFVRGKRKKLEEYSLGFN